MGAISLDKALQLFSYLLFMQMFLSQRRSGFGIARMGQESLCYGADAGPASN